MFDCNAGFDYCNCHCHTNPGTKHFMACCVMCPICHANIRIGMYHNHLETHEQKDENHE